jgi:predicted GNAT superfamily acetyltransferase
MSSLRATTSAAPNADLWKIRAANPADFESVLALNFESERFLSPLSRARLDVLHQQACLHQVVEVEGKVVAFVLALREGENYDSVNYRWFIGRYEQFMYVDRVVVSGALQGRGLGRVLYEAVFAHARATGVPVVTCEYDIDPPNPASARFHRAFGFLEVGRQSVAGGKKLVSLQVAQAGVEGNYWVSGHVSPTGLKSDLIPTLKSHPPHG